MRSYRLKNADGTYEWFVGYDFLLLLFAASFSGIMVMTMYAQVDTTIVDIAVFQLVMGLVGLMGGTVIAFGTQGLKTGVETSKQMTEALMAIIVGFVATRILNGVIMIVDFQNMFSIMKFDSSLNIALTAAVMEECLYSFLGSLFFFKVFMVFFSKVFRNTSAASGSAVVMASIFISVFFVIIHYAVYGFNMSIILMLFINRFVYSLLFLKTRNLMVPTVLHLAHNFLASM